MYSSILHDIAQNFPGIANIFRVLSTSAIPTTPNVSLMQKVGRF